MTTFADHPARRPSRATRALLAAGITGTLALAGVATATAASAASGSDPSGARAVDPGLQSSLNVALRPPNTGSCIVCGLGGYDPIFDGTQTGPLL